MGSVKRGRPRIKFTIITLLQGVHEAGLGGVVCFCSYGFFQRGEIESPSGYIGGECFCVGPVKLGTGSVIGMAIFTEKELEIVISAGLLGEFPG